MEAYRNVLPGSFVLYGLLILCVSSNALSQSQPVSVLTVNNGLASGTIESGFMDSRGFVWLGTREGLHRYDGRNVIRYVPNDRDSNAIRNQLINDIQEDARGRIWMLGPKGLEVYLPEENRFKYFKNTYEIGEHPILHLVNSLGLGIISSSGIPEYYFTLKDCEMIPLRSDSARSISAFLSRLWYWRGQKVSDAAFHSENKQYHLSTYHAPGNLQIKRLNREGFDLWATHEHFNGYLKFAYGQAKPEFVALKGLEELDDTPDVRSMMDYNDSLAMGAANSFGIYLFHKRTGKVLRKWDFRSEPSMSRITDIKFLFRDPAGIVWFSIMPYGVFVLDPFSPRFQLLRNGISGSLLYNGLMRSMLCDTAGRLWIGFHDGYLQVLNPECTREVAHWRYPRPLTSLSSHPKGHVLVNSDVELQLDPNGSWISKCLEGDRPLLPAAKTALNKDYPLEQVLLPSNRDPSKLMVFERDRNYYLTLPARKIEQALSYTTRKGLFILDQLSSHYLQFSLDSKDSLQFNTYVKKSGQIIGIYETPDSASLWLATNNGLSRYDLECFEIEVEDTRDWPSNFLYGILPDQKGNLWISSNAGIIRFHPENKQWKCFNIHDGMQSNEFNTNCYARMQDGSLAFGGPDGLNIFHPDYFDRRSQDFRVYLSGVKIHDKEQEGFSPFSLLQEFRLAPDEKSLEVSFASTLYFNRRGMRYWVQLQGADRGWVDVGDRESVRYINLKPGHYRFKLKAQDADGRWSENVQQAGFTVLPAFYQSSWFLFLCLILILSLAYSIYRYRISEIKKLHGIRNRISYDLHDDIGSTLGSISIYSEVAKTTEAKNRNEVLEKIGEASREMLEKLNDIIWSINPENDSPARMERRMRTFAAMLLNPLGIQFHLEFRVDRHTKAIHMDQRKNIFLIYKEALHNAAKYSGCKQVNIHFEEDHGRFRLDIRDDGKGFETHRQEVYNGTGMLSMKERAKAISSRFRLESQPGKGTQILVEYP